MKDYKWNKVFKPLIERWRPKTFCEIGCHEGLTLKSLIPTLTDLDYSLHYVGFDAFELADRPTFEHPINPFTKEMEHNGKESANYNKIVERCEKFKKEKRLTSYEIHKGWTHETLTKQLKFDMVFIDGGHSYSTVKWDYEHVKDSKIIIFDDVYQVKFPGVAKLIGELKQQKIKVEEIIEKDLRGKTVMHCAIIING